MNQVDNSKTTPLHIASSLGHLEIVELLLDYGAKVDVANDDGDTPLLLAVQSGNKELVKTLLVHGGGLKTLNARQQSALIIAALANGYDSIAELLLQYGAPIPWHWAVNSGRTDYVNWCMKNGVNSFDIDIGMKDEARKTPLMIAIENGNKELVELLIERGATSMIALYRTSWQELFQLARQRDDRAITLLLLQKMDLESFRRQLALTCISRDTELVRFFLENRASVLQPSTGEDPEIHKLLEPMGQVTNDFIFNLLLENSTASDFKKGTTLSTEDVDNVYLFHAARTGNIVKIRKLIKKTSALNTGNALYFAALNGHFEAARHLLANGGNPNFTRLTEGNTPLHGAVQNGHTKLVELLLSYGADLWRTNQHNVTPLEIAQQSSQAVITPVLQKHFASKLYQAVQESSEEVVERVLQADANLVNQIREADGASALWLAVQSGHGAVVKQLLDYQANTRQGDNRGYTPLHLAAMKGHTDIARQLIAAGTALNALCHDGYTPLHLAVLNGHKSMARLLLGAEGIDVNGFSANGETALHLAGRGEQTDIVRLLLGCGADLQGKDIQGDTILHIMCRGYGQQALEQAAHQLEGYFNRDTLRILNDRQETPLSLLMSRPELRGENRQQFMRLANLPPVRTGAAPRQHVHHAQSRPKASVFEPVHTKKKMPEDPIKKPGGTFTIEVSGSAFQISHHQLEPVMRGQELPGHVMAAMVDNPDFQLALDHIEEVMGISAAQQLARNHEPPLNYLVTYGTEATKQQLPGYYLTRVVSPRHNHLIVERKPATLSADDNCVICQYPLLTRDVLIRSPCQCRSYFHGYCLSSMLKTANNAKCPLCATSLPELASILCHSLVAEQELHSAARSGNRYIVKTMLEAGVDIDAPDTEGNTALHMAAQGGHSEIALLLVKHDVAPDQPNNAGNTAKKVAKQAGHLGVADIISEAINTPSIFFSVGHGNKDAVTEYLGLGEDVAITRPLDNYSLLHLAAENGQTEIVRILLATADSLNQEIDNVLDCHHRSPLYLAAENGHADIVDILLNRNTAMVEGVNSSGNTPLTAAALKGHVDAAFKLIEEDASLTTANKMGTTSLHAILKTFPEYALAVFLEKQAHKLTPALLTALNAHNQSPLSLLNSREDISAAMQQAYLNLAPDYVEEYFAEKYFAELSTEQTGQAPYAPTENAAGNECSICCDREKNAVLMPCRHMVCSTCSKKLETCPYCMKKVESTLEVYPQ